MDGKNKIVLSLTEEDADPVTYDIEAKGNKMRWTIDFGNDPDIDDDTQEIRLLVLEYTKA